LDQVLEALSQYYQRMEKIRINLKNALTYPLILLIMVLVVVGVILFKVLPVFDEVLRNLGVSPCGEEVLGDPDGAAHHRNNGGDGHQGRGGRVGDPAAVFDVAGEGEADAEQGHGTAE
ncbi:MAG: hypothetical protein EGW04_02030, partial [Rothia mucilaginosa]|nr:hypothetical protein [Rothia mucilaginosa]